MSKVYISQMTRAGMDFSSAGEYGDVVPVFPSSMNVYGGFAATGEFVNMARQRMADMTDQDYLILVGDPVMVAIVVAEAAVKCEGRLKILKWDKRKAPTAGYREVCVDLDAMPA